MSLQIRSLAAALVVVTLAGGTAQALPLSALPFSDGEEAGFLDTVWEWVVSFAQPAGAQSKSRLAAAKAGEMLDPGDSMTEAGCSWREEGGMMDPDGLK